MIGIIATHSISGSNPNGGITKEVKILEFFQKTSRDEEWGAVQKEEYRQRTQHGDVRIQEGDY